MANAGPDQTVVVGTVVHLDGHGSSDVDDDPLTYQWAFTALPMGSHATLSDPTAVQPTFLVDVPGTYTFQLIVHDGQAASQPDTTVISTLNSKPVADAGPDQTVEVDDTVQLDGSASRDADRDPLTFRWAFLARPDGSTAAPSDPAAERPTFVATDEHKVSVTLPDGKVEEFDLRPTPSSSQLVPLQEVTAQYQPRPGTRGTLVPLGDATLFIFDPQPGPVTLVTAEPDVYDPQVFEYTALNGTRFIVHKTARVQSACDLRGNTLTFGADSIVHSSGHRIDFVRAALGRITQLVDPNGNAQVYTYDANGDLATHTDAEGTTTRFLYNFSHGLLEIRDPRGLRPIRNEYDDNGRLIRHTDAFGHVITYAHDLDTRQEVITDRLGNITVHEYDQAGNVVRSTDALGGVTTRTYDARGNLLTETDALGRTRTYTYDAKDNRLTETDPLGNTTRYAYNERGQVLTITDPLGCVTTNTYDADGNLTATTDPLGHTTTYTYTASGLCTSMTNPLGHATTYTYDANGNRLSQTTTRTTPSGVDTLLTTYTYDGLNRLVR